MIFGAYDSCYYVRGVMVIVEGNKHNKPGTMLFAFSRSANTLRKGINPNILLLVMDKIIKPVMATGLRERKL